MYVHANKLTFFSMLYARNHTATNRRAVGSLVFPGLAWCSGILKKYEQVWGVEMNAIRCIMSMVECDLQQKIRWMSQRRVLPISTKTTCDYVVYLSDPCRTRFNI